VVSEWLPKAVTQKVSNDCNATPQNFYPGTIYNSDYMGTQNTSSATTTAAPGAPGTGGSTARFTISNNALYIVDNNNLHVYDISNTTSPQQVSNNNLGWSIETIFPYKKHLFMKVVYISLFALLVSALPFVASAQDAQESIPTPVVTGVITGAGPVTVGSTAALADTNTGGMWSSSNVAVATVSKHGIVTGMSAGTATISYAYADASFLLVIDVATITVNTTSTGANSDDRKAFIGAPVLLDIAPSIWIANDIAIPGVNVAFSSISTNTSAHHAFFVCDVLGFVTR
jgi:hypothetical protein